MTTGNSIVLLGFMASGKSHIGLILANKLGFTLYDTDALIEKQQGMNIKSIFDQMGEGHFRKLETKAIKKLLGIKNAVIVAGGGAPMFFDNAQMLKDLGPNFYLDASFDLILRRLKSSSRRPLGHANTPEDLTKIKELYSYRRPIYAHLGHSIDVNDENRDQTCDEILKRFFALKALAQCRTIDVEHPHHCYQIYLCDLRYIKEILESLGLSDHRALIITSENLTNILENPINTISSKLKNATVLSIKDGEQHKNLSSVNELHQRMFELNLTRKTVVIAIGGGNVGDVAGFAAATYLRGLPIVQIPSTLLAMVDSSIGGKTGVDLDIGKNLVGAFHAPKAVLLDKSLLDTLPAVEFSCGMAEMIKHAIIADKELFYQLKDSSFDLLSIERALKVKADIVFSDPYEHNIRAHLNLGHTFGHAIEKVSNYQIKHGFAVAMGLVLATKAAQRLGVLKEDFLPDLLEVLEKFDLPTKLPEHMSTADLLLAMKHDKKRDNRGLRLILPIRVGQVVIESVDDSDIF